MPSDRAEDAGRGPQNGDLPEGQVCPNPECHIDQRWRGFRGDCCPECACRLVVACSKCDSGAVEEIDGSPVCEEHSRPVVADGGEDLNTGDRHDGSVSGTDRSLHQQYEPEAPIHRAVNITRRRLIDRCRTKQHDDYDLWVGVDPVTGLETDFWRDDREKAVEDIAHKVRMGTCHVHECMVFLGEDSEALYCEDHRPDDYIECAEDGCEYPTAHTLTDYCSTHSWYNGRSVDAGTDRDGGESA